MKYPKGLSKGDTIGVCAPSSGVTGAARWARLDRAVAQVKALGYDVVETASVRTNEKCVSADAPTRAREFMRLYEDPAVAAIIPPWGGEFLMDMLPYVDFDALAACPPTWVCGYSDITTLTFPLTVLCDMATVHGANFMNMGYHAIHPSDGRVFEIMSASETIQQNAAYYGHFTSFNDITQAIYTLDTPAALHSLRGETRLSFEGRLIGGCMDVLCKLVGTRFAPVDGFLEKYRNDGFIWTLESCEMSAGDIYRTLWQMRECGWLRYCNGIVLGRPDGYADTHDFTFTDALQQGLGLLKVPVLYGADIGHIPPQMHVVNGAYGRVDYESGTLTVKQTCRA